MSNIVLSGPATDLTVLEKLDPKDVFAEGGTLQIYEAIKKEVSGFIADITTASGRKEIAALAYKVAQSKTFLDKIGKAFNADLKAKTKIVDTERGVIWDQLEALQSEVRRPLTEWEEAEAIRANGHKSALAEMEALNTFTDTPTTAMLRERMSRLNEINQRNWEENSEIALTVFSGLKESLTKRISSSEQADKEREELEALRAAKAEQEAKDAEAAREKAAAEERQRIEREAKERAEREANERIKAVEEAAVKAKEKAIADAENAERRIKEAEAAKVAAEAKAKIDAEQAVIRERERIAAEQKKLDDEALARENNKKHRAKINNEILYAIQEVWVAATVDSEKHGSDPAKLLVEAIARGKIPHVTISY